MTDPVLFLWSQTNWPCAGVLLQLHQLSLVFLYLLNDGVVLVILLLHQLERMDKVMLQLQAEGIGAIQHAY